MVVVMESTLKDIRDGASVLDLDPKATVGGGVEDLYGEDFATEDQLVTPWTVSVARSCIILFVWDRLLSLISAFLVTDFDMFFQFMFWISVDLFSFLEFNFCSLFLGTFFLKIVLCSD